MQPTLCSQTPTIPQRMVELSSGLAGTPIGGARSAMTTTQPDGRVVSWTPGPDPRFGMLVPLVKSQVLTTPGGRVLSISVCTDEGEGIVCGYP